MSQLPRDPDHDFPEDPPANEWMECTRCGMPLPPGTEPRSHCSGMKQSAPERGSGPSRVSDRRDEKRAARGLDTELEDWIEEQPCLLSGHPGHTCEGDVVAHHVRAKAHHGDWRITSEDPPRIVGNLVPLCSVAGHQGGPQSVHELGRPEFEQTFGVDLEHAARDYGEEFPGQPPERIQEKAQLKRVGA